MSTEEREVSAPDPVRSAGEVLVQPGRVFERLVRRPTWWFPLVAGIALSAIFSFFLFPKLDLEGTIRARLAKRQTSAATISDQVDKAVEVQQRLAPLYPAFGAIGSAFFFFVAAFALGLAANLFGSEAGYKPVISVYAYSQVPNLVKSVIGIGWLFTRPDASLRADRIAALFPTSLAALLPAAAPVSLSALAASLDIFTLAALALLVIGFRRLPGLAKGSATALPIVLWVAFVVVKVGWTAITG